MSINHPINPAPAEAATWTTKELQEEFSVESFAAGLVFVSRKSDGKKGTLEFNGNPRIYHTLRLEP